jgi:ligand-binding SRPBCC domain-containing protein
MPRIELVTEIAAPIDKVFDISRNIDVHQQSQAKNRERVIAGRTSGMIEEGEEVTWEAVHFGVRQRLTSRITAMKRPTHFRDSMVAGAFKRLDHDHNFETDPDGRTRMTDVFDYTSPLGLLGHMADTMFLKRYMRRLLEERNAIIKSVAESSTVVGRLCNTPPKGKNGGMRRWKRICMNLLLPSLVAAGILISVGVFSEVADKRGHFDFTQDSGVAALVLLFSYVYAIIPSAIFMGAMEWLYQKKGLRPSSIEAVGASMICGALSGLLIGMFFAEATRGSDSGLLTLILVALGAVVGLAVGILVKLAEERALRVRLSQSS